VEVQFHAFFDLGSRCRWVVSFTPRPLYPQGKSPLYPLDRRLGGSQGLYGRGVEEKNSQPPPGFEPQSSDSPARSQSLYQLNYTGSCTREVFDSNLGRLTAIPDSCFPGFTQCLQSNNTLEQATHASFPTTLDSSFIIISFHSMLYNFCSWNDVVK
jgi:hypothetical protein